MATTRWAAPNSPETVLSTELNSLADGAQKLSAAISNDQSGERYLFADIEMSIATQGSARSAGAQVQLFLLSSIDNSNFSYGDDSTSPPLNTLIGAFPFDASTTARRAVLRGIELPPADFKLLILNDTGQALAASGNTLKMIRYNLETA